MGQLGRGLGGRMDTCQKMLNVAELLDAPPLWLKIDRWLSAAALGREK